MKLRILTAIIVVLALASACSAKVDVVTSAPNLASLARSIGGDLVNVTSLARPQDDLHFVEPRPSFVTKLKNADMVVIYGMSYDVWMRTLIDNSRNRKIAPGGAGYVDASVGIRKMEIPAGKIDMSMGELHPQGNPHYLLDPDNARIAAKSILGGLIRVSPGNEDRFRAGYDLFVKRLDTAIDKWDKQMRPFKGKPVVTYHKSWIYFTSHFGLDDAGTIEPKPSIPPSPSHVSRLVSEMKKENIKVIMLETFYPRKFPDLIARQTGAGVVVIPHEVGEAKGTDTYISLMDHIVGAVAGGLQ